jgi:O-antigen ligase
MEYINNFWTTIKLETKQNKSFVFIVLALISIPLKEQINTVFLGLLVLSTLLYFKKNNFIFDKNLVPPILLYGLMLWSYFWTIAVPLTVPALIKEIPLLIIPLCFMVFGGINEIQKNKIIKAYSYAMVGFSIFYLSNAIFKYISTQNPDVFFYHELVTKIVNAIYVSVFMAVAFFYFFTKTLKNKTDYFAMCLLLLMIFLLSSKNIILVFILLIILYHLFYSKLSKKLRLKNLLVFGIFLVLIFSFGKIKNRFEAEFQTNNPKSLSSNVIENVPQGVHSLSIKEAWSNQNFTPNDFFPGTAFRVYQFRIFLEMLCEDNIFWTGYGLNASYPKIEQKGIEHNVYLGIGDDDGYQKKNFHNQFIQNFAELGIFGFLILILMLGMNLKNGLKNKDFIHISFAIIMISLFLTESFLWRQRGVVFFTLMFCVFNIMNYEKKH